MKKPDLKGGLAESLYSFEDGNKTNDKLGNPPQNCNLVHPRPSIIPGIQYPISDKEEKLLDKAWNHFCNLKSRG